MASEPSTIFESSSIDLETLPADDILGLFNYSLSTNVFSSLSEHEITHAIIGLYNRITSETDDNERETLFCVLNKILQIVEMDNIQYLLGSL